jgi:hypothetical protein
MESAEGVAAKRRVLIDALMMCLEKSRVVKVVDGKTIRGVINSASGELWREGEFRLEPVWKILIAQPGLTAEEVAPPLLAFKAYEKELGVQVRIPQALSAIPRGEQVRLRETLELKKQDFEKAMAEMRIIATDEQRSVVMAEIVREASGKIVKSEVDIGPVKPVKRRQHPLVAVGLTLAALAAISGSAWFALRDTASGYDLADVAGILQLANGKAVGPSMTATITDPRWETLPVEERKKLAGELLDAEAPKGIRAISLVDASGRTRASVSDGPEGRIILVP